MKPNAKSASVSMHRGQVQVRVKAPAIEGKANEACRKALAKTLGLAPSSVKLIRGAHSRVRIFALTEMTTAELAVKLARLPP